MKKKVCLLCSILCVMCLLVGCDSSGSSGNASITDNWQLVEWTVNGKTEKFKDIPPDSLSPQFSCTDGTNFTFSLKGKGHSGTLTESEGVYTLTYNDTFKKMEARISGNRMTITMADSDVMELIFETK